MAKKKAVKKSEAKKAKPDEIQNDNETIEEEPKNVGGRPRKEIDLDNLEALCEMQCTELEIASFFGCSEDTVARRIKENWGMTFADFIKLKKGRGIVSLKRKFWQELHGIIEERVDGEIIQKRKKPNSQFILHAMKTVGGLNEKMVLEHQGADGGAIKFANKSTEELTDEVRNMLRLVEEATKGKKKNEN